MAVRPPLAALGIGGNGDNDFDAAVVSGGGGGGGLYGGGGGHAKTAIGQGTGGGGGGYSSLLPAGRTVALAAAGAAPQVQITYTPAGGGGTPPPPTKATISALGETNSTFAVGRSSTPLTGQTSAKRHKQGTTFSFRLDQPATVKIAIQTKTRGRRVGRTCRPDSRSLRRRPRCTRTVTIATLTRTARAGLNKIAFTGRIRGKALKPGRYQAAFTAVDAAGESRSRTLSFTIVKR